MEFSIKKKNIVQHCETFLTLVLLFILVPNKNIFNSQTLSLHLFSNSMNWLLIQK